MYNNHTKYAHVSRQFLAFGFCSSEFHSYALCLSVRVSILFSMFAVAAAISRNYGETDWPTSEICERRI